VSKGEARIIQLFKRDNIYFEREKRFQNQVIKDNPDMFKEEQT